MRLYSIKYIYKRFPASYFFPNILNYIKYFLKIKKQMKNFLITILLASIYISLCLSLKQKKKDEPMSLTVTYVTPLRDYEEQKKYMEEHLNYSRNFKILEEKFNDDLETLKMMFNQQNNQIEKLNSIVHTNFASARELKSRK
jgi:hypothetical protein